MLLKRKVKQKKVVVKSIEWVEKPVDVCVQEKKELQATFTARLSEKEKKGKWYVRNNVSLDVTLTTYVQGAMWIYVILFSQATFKDIRAGEHGLVSYVNVHTRC